MVYVKGLDTVLRSKGVWFLNMANAIRRIRLAMMTMASMPLKPLLLSQSVARHTHPAFH